MTDRERSWLEEDESEEPAAGGTRRDMGVGAELRDDGGPGPGVDYDRGALGSVSDVATGTGATQRQPSSPEGGEATRSLEDFGADGADVLRTGGHNSGARSPVGPAEGGTGNTLNTLNNPTESTPQRPD
ncbi:MAG: hypothetical protein M3301_04495 [Chloroflexota bacterium]|nr:hypothetical protein [Chloroflexota bacterium]